MKIFIVVLLTWCMFYFVAQQRNSWYGWDAVG